MSDLTLDKLILKEAAKENFYASLAAVLALNMCLTSLKFQSVEHVEF